jgi:hypothetical protein
MDQFQLNWVGPFKVSELKKKTLEESISKVPPWMTWQGIYIFLDQNFHVLYVGSATKGSGYALRSRIREHLREGAQTSFSRQLKKNNMNIDDLQLIAASDTKEEFTYKDILKIEGIITREMNPPGNSDDVGEIVNYGSFKPALPERIQTGLSGYLKTRLTK